jgi:hypothetical protein
MLKCLLAHAPLITDLAQCVERADGLDAPIYTQCRNP